VDLIDSIARSCQKASFLIMKRYEDPRPDSQQKWSRAAAIRRMVLAGLVVAVGSAGMASPIRAGGLVLCRKQYVVLLPDDSSSEGVVYREIVRSSDGVTTTPSPQKSAAVSSTPQQPVAKGTAAPAANERTVTVRYIIRDVPASSTATTRAVPVTVRMVRVAPVERVVTVRETQTVQGVLVKPRHCWKW
jgi:hypothetical protein